MVSAQTRICLRKLDSEFEIQMDHPIPTKIADLVLINKKKVPFIW